MRSQISAGMKGSRSWLDSRQAHRSTISKMAWQIGPNMEWVSIVHFALPRRARKYGTSDSAPRAAAAAGVTIAAFCSVLSTFRSFIRPRESGNRHSKFPCKCNFCIPTIRPMSSGTCLIWLWGKNSSTKLVKLVMPLGTNLSLFRPRCSFFSLDNFPIECGNRSIRLLPARKTSRCVIFPMLSGSVASLLSETYNSSTLCRLPSASGNDANAFPDRYTLVTLA